jgi:hypothetical protein
MRALHDDAGPEQLAVARIGVFGLWLIILLRVDPRRFADLPSELATPLGAMHLFPLEAMVGSSWVMTTMWGLAVLGCGLCVLGVRPFLPVALPTSLLLLAFDGSMKAFGGYANHAQSAALFAALIIALFPASDAWSAFVKVKRPEVDVSPWIYRTPLILATLALALTYSLVGLRRIVAGGPAVFLGDSVEVWLVAASSQWAEYGFDHGLLILEHRWLVPVAAVALLVATTFEVLAPLVLRTRQFRVAWVLVVVSFHIGTLLTMRIFFWENLVLIALLVTPLPSLLIERVGSWRNRTSSPAG